MGTLAERLILAMKGPPAVRQADLARACEVRPPSVTDWLSGRTKRLEGANLLRASRFLNVNPEWLSTGRGPMRLNASPSAAVSENFSPPKMTSGSQHLIPDPVILHRAVTLLLFDLDHGGWRSANTATSILLDLYRRIAAGTFTDADERAFEEEARSRGEKTGGVKHAGPATRTRGNRKSN